MRTLFFVLFCFPWIGKTQLLINEVCSDNKTVLLDNYGDSSDWIELYNTGTTTVNTEGYYLSDAADNLRKWAFPERLIPAQGRLLMFASDRAETLGFLHTNFKLSSGGESLFLTDATGQLLHQMDIPALDEDVSYGQQMDGNGMLVYFDVPSPNAPNIEAVSAEIAARPELDSKNFFHESEHTISMTCTDPMCQIYYTLDGSIPNRDALLYTAPFLLEKSTTVRAITYVEGLQPSAVATQTYFVNVAEGIPIVAISTEADLLFDEVFGLFKDGPDAESEWPFLGANYWKGWEVPVHLEYYEGHEKTFAQDVGMKAHGGRSSRTNPLKSVRFLAKDGYGLDVMKYPFLESRERDEYKRIVLRNASGDYHWAYMRDAFLNTYVLQEGLDVDCLAAQPVAWYINGEFWALVYLREKSDEFYLQNNFDVDIANLDFLEEDTTVILGDFEHFDALYDFVRTHDLSEAVHFETASAQFDVYSLADYFIVETLCNNTDWLTNNIKFWRERTEGAKWRYLLFDMDIALSGRGWSNAEVDSFGDKMTQYQDTNRHVNILQAFFEYEDYRHYFINRYADLTNTSFEYHYFKQNIAAFRDIIDPYMPAHLGKWQNQTYDTWRGNRLARIDTFAMNRPHLARQYVNDYFDLNGQVALTLNVFPPEAGQIQVNTIVPKTYPWTGYYFDGVPVALTVLPNPGFEFEGWESLSTIPERDPRRSIAYNFEKSDAISAYFKSKTEGLSLSAAPNPTNSTDIHFSVVLDEISALSYSLYQVNGQAILQTQTPLLNAGRHVETIDAASLAKGIYILRVSTNRYQESTKIFYVGEE